MDEPVKTGHVYPAGAVVFHGSEDEAVYRARNAMLVKALRSGDFTQARSALEAVRITGYRVETTGNCCLGVACRVAAIEANFSVITQNAGATVDFGTVHVDDEGKSVHSLMSGGYPPPLVSKWFGWNDNNPMLWGRGPNYQERVSAAHMNDSMCADFDTIADAFERTFVTFTRKSVDDLTDDTYQRDAEGHAETTVTDLPG